MACDKLFKEALTDILGDINKISPDGAEWVPDEEIFDRVYDVLSREKLWETKLDYSITIDEMDDYLVNPKKIREAIYDIIPELKKGEISSLQSYLPKKGTYIEPREVDKYRASREYTPEQQAAITARMSAGYISDLDIKSTAQEIADSVYAINLHTMAENGKISKEIALEQANKLAGDNPYGSFDDLLLDNDQALSLNWINDRHKEAAVIIDKPMYIAKSPYMQGDLYLEGKPHYLVSASVVNPYKPRAYEDIATMAKLPTGTPVTFTTNGTEVVVELRHFKTGGEDIKVFKQRISAMKNRIKELSGPGMGLLLYSLQEEEN